MRGVRVWECLPHVSYDLEEHEILSMKDGNEDEKHGNQNAQEEHHGLDEHAWTREDSLNKNNLLHLQCSMQ